MIKIIMFIMCCIPLLGNAQYNYKIKGKIGSLKAPSKIYLGFEDEGRRVLDSAIFEKGYFSFMGKVNGPCRATLGISKDGISKPSFAGPDVLIFYLENADITVNSDESIKDAIVLGSATEDENRILTALQRPYSNALDSASKTELKYVTRKFIADYPNSVVSLRAFKRVELGYNFNPDTAAFRFNKFSKRLRETVYGKEMASTIELGKKTNIGEYAQNFTEPDTIGKMISLSEFRGGYVLLDFWASWCKPCREENPNLLAAYNKYSKNNFTILGVSLDNEHSKSAWLGALKQDALPWTQISELNGFNSKSAEMYGIAFIPSNFLIDPSGKIIARNLRGRDLDKKLAEIFDK